MAGARIGLNGLPLRQSGITAMALISIRASGEVFRTFSRALPSR
jgi:hypothetical protein